MNGSILVKIKFHGIYIMLKMRYYHLAGLYSEWTSQSTGEVFNTFSIITTDANDLTAEIHNSGKRMPAILDKQSETVWLDLSIKESEADESSETGS